MATPRGEGPDRPPGPPPVEHLSSALNEVGSPGERQGPLELRRYLKEDGRALILYERVEDEK